MSSDQWSPHSLEYSSLHRPLGIDLMTRTINICVDDRFAERKSAGDWPLFHGLSMGPMCVRTGAIIEWTDDFPPPDGISIKVSIYLHSIRRGKFLPF